MRYAGDPGPWLATPGLLESLSRWNYLLGERGELEVGDAFSGVIRYCMAWQSKRRSACVRVCVTECATVPPIDLRYAWVKLSCRVRFAGERW